MRKERSEGGFTLIELLVVIAIIGLLSAIVLAALNTARTQGRDARRASDMHSVVNALQMYYLDNNARYPGNYGTHAACANTYSCLANITSALVPKYLGAMPQDPAYPNHNLNYRYCTINSGAVTWSVLYRLNEATGNFCVPQQPGLPQTGTVTCQHVTVTNGVPVPAAGVDGWCPD
jgi:prepilin-type N-terminal cleavage/methylation domain-containing protein